MKDESDTQTLELPGLPLMDSGVDLRGIEALGYDLVGARGLAGICGVRNFLFTGALVTGLSVDSYEGRYCYPTLQDAAIALLSWNGDADPPGGWIKFKGRSGERLGPGCNTEN